MGTAAIQIPRTLSDIQAIGAIGTVMVSSGSGVVAFRALANTDISGLGTAALVNTGTGTGNVPVLDGSGKLSSAVLPAIVINDTFVVASQAAMLALTAERGDIAVRTDINKSFVLVNETPGTLANWQELLSPTAAVTSVAGRTGAVSLANTDISGLGTMSTQAASSVAITGGSIALTTPLPIASGGTGAATSNANLVLAGPSSGGAGALSIRSLVAADIPSLTLSKISDAGSMAALTNTGGTSIVTLGNVATGTWSATTVAINKGGTGQTTANAALNAFLPSQTGNSGKALFTNGTDASWSTVAGSGTVTSVALAMPGDTFSVSGSPVTAAGTLTATFSNQSAHTFHAGPASGSPATPTWRVIDKTDVPSLDESQITNLSSDLSTLTSAASNAQNDATNALSGLTNKLDRTSSFSGGNIIVADGSGSLADGGHQLSEYPLASSLGTMSTQNANNVTITGGSVTGMSTPSASGDVATKGYVDGLVQGLQVKPPARVATTTTLTAYTYANGSSGVGATLTANSNGAITAIDGITLAAGDRVLVKNETSGNTPYNGLYVLTQTGDASHPWILTRDISMDVGAEFLSCFVVVEAGTTNGGSRWVCTATTITVGTTNVTFTELNIPDYTAGTGITISGSTISINTSWAGQAAITTLGTIAAGVWQGTAVAVAYGGTGGNSQATARSGIGCGTMSVLADTGGSSIVTVGTITTGIWNGTNIAVANGGTGSGTAAGAATNLGLGTGDNVTHKALITTVTPGGTVSSGTYTCAPLTDGNGTRIITGGSFTLDASTSGSPAEMFSHLVRITYGGTHTVSFGSGIDTNGYTAVAGVSGKVTYFQLIWNVAKTKWDLLAPFVGA